MPEMPNALTEPPSGYADWLKLIRRQGAVGSEIGLYMKDSG